MPTFGGWGTEAYNANQRQMTADQLDQQARLQGLAMRAAGGGLGAGSLGGGSYSGGSSSGSSSSSLGGSSVLPSVGSVPAGPAGMPQAPSVDASPNLQSYSEQLRYDPWAANRAAAGTQLAGEMGQASPSEIYQQKLAEMANGTFSPDDPSYQWRFQQGQQAVERSMAAKGLLNSGNAAIELQQYGQGAASQEYGAQFQRMLQGLSGSEDAYNTQMGRLMQMAGVNIDPTAGGQLNVAQEQAGIDRGRLSLASQELANQYDLGYRGLGIQQQELGIKAQAAQNAKAASLYSIIFGNSGSGGGGGSSTPSTSWDAYFAARDASQAGNPSYGLSSTGGYGSNY